MILSNSCCWKAFPNAWFKPPLNVAKPTKLRQRLEKRRSTLANRLPADLTIIQLAIAQQNERQAIDGLKSMSQAAGINPQKTVDENATAAVHIQGNSVAVANLLLHAALPVADLRPDDPTAKTILQTASQMVRSRSRIGHAGSIVAKDHR